MPAGHNGRANPRGVSSARCQRLVSEADHSVPVTINDTYAIRAEGLVKRFGNTVAVNGVDLNVEHGTVVGLLGPNGAGKTTVVRMLSTLLRLDGGHAEVGGFDVMKQSDEVRARIGLTGQYAAVDEDLTGFENLLLIGKLLEYGSKRAKS